MLPLIELQEEVEEDADLSEYAADEVAHLFGISIDLYKCG